MESKGKYDVEDSTENAMAMAGAGYDKAAVIERPRTVQALGDSGLEEYQVFGWIKMSASFCKHIKKLRGAKLAIWLCLALNIDENGVCKLSQKELCTMTGYSHTEVIDSVSELNEMRYLSVDRSGKGNLYKPVFVAKGKGKSPSKETLVKKLDSTPADSLESSPALEESPPIPIKKELELNINERTALLKKLYENNIAMVVPIMWEKLKLAAMEYTDPTWYAPAFAVAADRNAMNWGYINTVLMNWKTKGRGWSPAPATKSNNKISFQQGLEAVRFEE